MSPAFICAASGKLIDQHVTEGVCPRGYFQGADPPPRPPAAPRPLSPNVYSDWPTWAKITARLKSRADAGVGDTVHRILGRFGKRGEEFLKRIGLPCGCSARRADWNVLYGY